MSRPISSRQRYREFVSEYRARERPSEPLIGRRTRDGEHSEGTTGPRLASVFKELMARMSMRSRPFRPALQRKYIRDYWHWLKPYRTAVAVVFALSVASTGLQMVEPLFMRFIVDDVLLVTASDTSLQLHRLNLVGIAFLSLVLISRLIGMTRDYRQRLLSVRITLSLRRALFSRLLRLPLPKLWDMKTGGILSRLTGDVDTTRGLLQTAVISPAIAAIRLLVAAVILLSLNWQLALAALAVIPGVLLLSVMLAHQVRPIYRSVRKDAEQIDGRAGETFAGIRIVRAFQHEASERLGYVRARHIVARKELFAHRRELALWSAWGILLGLVNVIIVWYGGLLNVAGYATVGDIMAFQWYSVLLLTPVWQIVHSMSELQRSLASTERVFEVLALPDDKPDRHDAQDAPRVVRSIRLDNVGFAYRPGQLAVRDFSLTVKGGSMIALVGRSGAGKTTVTDLIARFHDPTYGRILINGSDIRDFRLGTYRGLLGIVQQEVFLFDGSVHDNIAYGRNDASEAAVEDAARRAHAHEFIEQLPEQYRTLVGERGVKLSGGQQQRLAIARAILADPQILILDEATSNLDTENELLIRTSMAALLAGRTTFVIAHRLSTIRDADMILLMEDGRIVERGTHDELMRARGRYHTMVRLQSSIDPKSWQASPAATARG